MSTVELDEPAVIEADAYFAITPEYVLFAKISANATRLFAVLHRYANDPRRAHLSRAKKELAWACGGWSVSTFDRARDELKSIGALTVLQQPNPDNPRVAGECVYRIHQHGVMPEDNYDPLTRQNAQSVEPGGIPLEGHPTGGGTPSNGVEGHPTGEVGSPHGWGEGHPTGGVVISTSRTETHSKSQNRKDSSNASGAGPVATELQLGLLERDEPDPRIPRIRVQHGVKPTLFVFKAFLLWLDTTGRTLQTHLDATRDGILRRAVDPKRLDFPEDDVLDAIRGVALSDWHMGREERSGGVAYNDLNQVVGTTKLIEKFRDMHRNGLRPPASGNGSNGNGHSAGIRTKDDLAGYWAHDDGGV